MSSQRVKKSVCLVNAGVYSLFNPHSSRHIGGSEVWTHTIAYHLARAYRVSVVTGNWGQAPQETYGDVTVYASVDLRSKNYLKQAIVFWRGLHRANADVYISSGLTLETGLIRIFCWRAGKKHIVRTFSDADCNKTRMTDAPRWLAWLYTLGIERADVIVATVRDHISTLRKHHPRLRPPLIYIPVGINMPAKIHYQKKGYVLWVSRCVRFKNPDIVLDIAEQMPNRTFVMVAPRSDREEEFFSHIQHRAQQLPNVQFHDYVPFQHIQRLYNEACLFLNTSSGEGFPHTFLHSGVGKTPLVSLVANPDDVIRKYNIGYCSENDVSLMMRHILSLLDDKRDWQEKSRNIFTYVLKHHNARLTSRAWQDLISDVLSPNATGASSPTL